MPSTLAPEQIAKVCEAFFQRGGSRTQVFSAGGQRTSSPDISGAAALRFAFPGETVYARRKVRGLYEWVIVGTVK